MSVVNAIDKRLWWLHIIEPMMRGLVRISTWQTATRVGQTNEWQAINNNKQYAWLPYEYVYRRDANTNAMSARLVPTSPQPTAAGANTSAENPALTDAVQGVEVQTAASPAVPLIFGDDYRINFPDGSVTLTADGESKRGREQHPVKVQLLSLRSGLEYHPSSERRFPEPLGKLEASDRSSGYRCPRTELQSELHRFTHRHREHDDSGPILYELGCDASRTVDRNERDHELQRLRSGEVNSVAA